MKPHEQVVFNKETNEMRECFVVQFKQRDGKNKGEPMQVISEESDQFSIMAISFEVASQRQRQTDDERNGSILAIE